MKKILLALIITLTTFANALAVDLTWGKATWNIQDGTIFEDIDDINLTTVKLTFGNFTNTASGKKYFISGDLVAVEYDVYVDDATEPVRETSVGDMSSLEVTLNYKWTEGHRYKVITTNAVLTKPDMSTHKTDTLSMSSTPYTISFTINGPEIVKTINAEGIMSLNIINQNYSNIYSRYPMTDTIAPRLDPIGTKTFSPIDVNNICQILGVGGIDETEVYGLNANGSYNAGFRSYDGWRDADGEYTKGYGNDNLGSYSILLNETCDTISYYIHHTWNIYNPNEEESVPGTGMEARRRAMRYPAMNDTIWDWTNEDGTVTKYKRRYRVTEGEDYKAGFIVKANGKAVIINATLHFVDGQTYEAYIKEQEGEKETTNGDLDGDGRITPADITKLINIYLSNKQ